jgi:hypothetical protein
MKAKSDLSRRLSRLEAHIAPPPRPWRWVVCDTPTELAAEDAQAIEDGVNLVTWAMVDPKLLAST